MVDHPCIIGSTLQDVFISKIDASGNMLWYKSYGSEITDIGVDVKELSNGDLIILSWFAETDTVNTPYTSFHLIKTDSEEDSLWTRHYYHNDIRWSNMPLQLLKLLTEVLRWQEV